MPSWLLSATNWQRALERFRRRRLVVRAVSSGAWQTRQLQHQGTVVHQSHLQNDTSHWNINIHCKKFPNINFWCGITSINLKGTRQESAAKYYIQAELSFLRTPPSLSKRPCHRRILTRCGDMHSAKGHGVDKIPFDFERSHPKDDAWRGQRAHSPRSHTGSGLSC